MKRIGKIQNYYGGLVIKEENGEYYWAIENYNGYEWEKIPKHLYDTLIKYEINEDEEEDYD